MKKALKITGIVLAVAACWVLYRAYALPPVGPMGEVIDPEEEVLTSDIIANGVSIVNSNRTGGEYRRDGHPKSQGCALATFRVNDSLDWPYRQGVFAQQKSYKAWIRFSSGNPTVQSDWMPDARGMAIKLLGVLGEKLLDGEMDAHTQDFVMMNNDVFFIDNVRDYAAFTRLQVEGYQKGSILTQFRYFFENASGSIWHPLAWRLRAFREAAGILKWPPKNLLATQYYSIAAYTLGVQNYVKYSARPVACGPQEPVPGSWEWSLSSEVLYEDMVRQINSGRKFCFDFMVQTQIQLKNMPVEDTTIEWKEKDSPFLTVARIEIPKQNIREVENSNFCENLSFSPWHALPQHRPVGGLNRIRKAVYQGISQYRHCKNGVATGEPKDDGSPVLESSVCNANKPFPGSAKN